VSYRSPECIREIYPTSINISPQDNTTYLSSLNQLRTIFSNFSLVVTDVVEDLPQRKICMWLSARADTLAGEYVNEYVWNMEFDEEGKKIVRFKEFVDTVMARDFFPKLMAAMKSVQSAKEILQDKPQES